MSDDPEPWDKPSKKLERLVNTHETPNMRLCSCRHFHPKGERCGHWMVHGNTFCTCEK